MAQQELGRRNSTSDTVRGRYVVKYYSVRDGRARRFFEAAGFERGGTMDRKRLFSVCREGRSIVMIML